MLTQLPERVQGSIPYIGKEQLAVAAAATVCSETNPDAIADRQIWYRLQFAVAVSEFADTATGYRQCDFFHIAPN